MKNVWRGMLLFLVALGATACLDSDDELRDKVENVELTVASRMVERFIYPTRVNYPVWMEFMQVKEGKSDTWHDWSPRHIDNFDYEEGYEYVLSAHKITLANPPADGPDTRYSLIKIITKKQDKEVPYAQRFYVRDRNVEIRGDSMLVGEMNELKAELLDSMKQNLYSTFKFTYTDEAATRGNAVRYISDLKKEGTFQLDSTEWNGKMVPVYTLLMEGKTSRFLYIPYNNFYSSYYRHALAEDVTETYQPAYPKLEAVYALWIME